jgi:hexokinase
VAELYPHFRERVNATLLTLLGEKTAKRVRIGLAKDGSGVGGAFPRVLWLHFWKLTPENGPALSNG